MRESRLWKLGFPVALIATLALVMAACGTDEPVAEDPAVEDPADDAVDEPVTDADTEDPIVIGFSVAQTGALAPYDWEPTLAAQMRIEELNAEGGVIGRQIEYTVIDNQSEPALNSSNALDLIDQGVDVLLTTSDFDFGAPAMIEAQNAGIVGFFICASDPKTADRQTIGDMVFSLCWGTNNEGAVMAEWAVESAGWERAFMLEDISLEYSKSLAWATEERFTELGGEIVERDQFNALEADADVSAQVTRIRDVADDIDVIFVPSWVPAAPAVALQIRQAGIDVPILGGTANDGEIVEEVAGPIDDYYAVTFGCYNYCTGTDKPELDEFAAAFEEEVGYGPPSVYTMKGYDLISILAMGIEAAGTTDGPALRDALTNLEPVELLSGTNDFTEEWNQPQLRDGTIQEYQGGEWSFIERWTPSQVPDPRDYTG